MLQTRYNLSLTKNTDVNGLQHSPATNTVQNSFGIRRARLNIRSQVSERFDLGLLLNFAEFSNTNIAGRVLENAFARYSLNDHFHVIAGQFRPYFGLEDAIQNDFIKSLDFSNGYYLFGRNGWQSFQTGVAIYGNINKTGSVVPVKYFIGIHNGNGRNQQMDNDNGKHFYTRLEADVTKKTKLGVNGGIGTVKNIRGNVYGIDAKTVLPLNQLWEMELRSEYKNGNNFENFLLDSTIGKKLANHRMQTWFVNPIMRYKILNSQVKAIEFSSRFEHLRENYKINSNSWNTLTPMVSVELAEEIAAVLQVGANINRYKKQVPLTSQNNNTLFVTQLQLRF